MIAPPNQITSTPAAPRIGPVGVAPPITRTARATASAMPPKPCRKVSTAAMRTERGGAGVTGLSLETAGPILTFCTGHGS